MEYRAILEERVSQLVGRRIQRVRYSVYNWSRFNAHGHGLDVDIDTVVFDFKEQPPAYATWSNECGECYGLTIDHERHWLDQERTREPNDARLIDVTRRSRWQEVMGTPIVEARMIWVKDESQEVLPSGIFRDEGNVDLDLSQLGPKRGMRVPHDLLLRFESGVWKLLSVSEYDSKRGCFPCMRDQMLVVHDGEIARKHEIGPFLRPEWIG